MVRIDLGKYIDELKGVESEAEEMDLYLLKKELMQLSDSSKIFEEFEKESMVVNKDVLSQIQDLSSLIKIRKLASEIKNKNLVNEKLHSFHFNLNILKNSSNFSSVKNALNVFLYDDKTKIDGIINDLNDFKTNLDQIKKCHSNLLSKTLDNKLEIENRYNRYIEQLYLIHKKQKNALISTIKLFLKLAKKHIKSLKKFK